MTARHLRPSLFPLLPPYIHFLPPGEKYEDEVQTEVVLPWTAAEGTSPLILECVARAGYTVVQWSSRDFGLSPGPAWDRAMVNDSAHPVDFLHLSQGIKVNKFPSTLALSRKNKLWNNYRRMQRVMGKRIFNFLPQTFNMPEDKKDLTKAMRKGGLWICKPASSSCGLGIHLVTSQGQVQEGGPKSVISVQKYITDPLLIKGLKFDLRLYVLLTSIDPIRLYLYEDGLVRFATKPFTLAESELNNKFVHLTNYSVNKENEHFCHNEDREKYSGHKWSLKMLWQYLEEEGKDTDKVWTRIKRIVVKTILCGQEDILKQYKEAVNSDYSCYKLFGVDVMLDSKMKPWLLELNNFPSLEQASLDRHVNEPMLSEMFNIVGFHLTPAKPLTSRQKSSLVTQYELVGGLEMEPRLYSRDRSRDQVAKEEMWMETWTRDREDCLSNLLGVRLRGRDVRVLVQAEQELEQTKGFCRLLPGLESPKYLEYLDRVGDGATYSDVLLAAWELEYSGDRGRGRELLETLCGEGKHLEES